ncbi:methionine gamma-lyase [Paremcibacter congregatus]|uniref:methionine gamma-lyase n=1 Tax=Paremcibacter congregatus TaxID=2043170 RepID=UPI0030EC98C1|tara:strand:+ start:2944 stop:4140 length:1197 start_codon:yes stop_codon:yes gene_type:complete
MSSLDPKKRGFATRAIHAGRDHKDPHGALTSPIYMTSTFEFETAEQGGARFAGEEGGYIYSRLGNPTLTELENKLADLEGAEACLTVASGMGAITSVFWSFIAPGDEILVDETLYGCTFAYFRHGLEKFGITVRHVDMRDPENLAQEISAKTKIVYFETPANPNMRIVDIKAVSEIAHSVDARVVVDNTYMTPYLQNPITLGADIVVHSATKYLGGHGDLMAGVILSSAEDMEQIRYVGLKDMTGAVLSPMNAFLISRGLKTLELRMERHCDNAEKVAAMLEASSKVEKVYFPGLPSFEQHELAKAQMTRFGGMVAFELTGGHDAGLKFLNSLDLCKIAVSLGDAETLIEHPASMTHSPYEPEERAKYGITEGLVRISAGLENATDILADLEQALARV